MRHPKKIVDHALGLRGLVHLSPTLGDLLDNRLPYTKCKPVPGPVLSELCRHKDERVGMASVEGQKDETSTLPKLEGHRLRPFCA